MIKIKNNRVIIMSLAIPPKIWEILKAIPFSLTASEIAKKSGISYNSVIWFLKNHRKNYVIGSEFDYRRMGLIPLIVLSSLENNSIKLPPYTFSVSEISSCKKILMYKAFIPEDFVNDYLRDIDSDIFAVIKGYELLRWFPFSKLTTYIKQSETIEPLVSRIYEVYNEVVSQRISMEVKRAKIDIIDLYIMLDKLRFSYTKLSETLKRLKQRVDPNITKQLVSYHFNKHVKPLWRYNYVMLLQDVNIYPLRAYYFEGKDAETLGRLLVHLPYMLLSFIDLGKSLVVAQPPPHMEYLVYDIVSMFDVKMPLGELLLHTSKISRCKADPIGLYVDNKWIYPRIVKEVKIMK